MITVFLITDDPAVRARILVSVALESDMLLMGQADSVMRALELVPRLEPRVILLDTDAPGADAASAARLLRAVSAESAVIVLGVPDSWATQALAQQAGAAGFVPDWENADTLRAAIRRSTFRAA